MTVSKSLTAVPKASSPVSRVRDRAARVSRKAASQPSPVEVPVSVSCLEQAEICREQARDAARLRRFKAALGLFATAAVLCKRALALPEGDDSIRALAKDRLHQIEIEIATYSDLARAMERPRAV